MLGRLQHYDLGSLLIGIVDLDRRHLRIAQEVVRGAVVNDILQVVGPAAVAFFIMQFPDSGCMRGPCWSVVAFRALPDQLCRFRSRLARLRPA
jgi:hypothetical protein